MRTEEASVTGFAPTSVRRIAPVSLTTSVSTLVVVLAPRSWIVADSVAFDSKSSVAPKLFFDSVGANITVTWCVAPAATLIGLPFTGRPPVTSNAVASTPAMFTPVIVSSALPVFVSVTLSSFVLLTVIVPKLSVLTLAAIFAPCASAPRSQSITFSVRLTRTASVAIISGPTEPYTSLPPYVGSTRTIAMFAAALS